MPRQSCAVCAWRETCAKRFCVSDGGARCPDFSRDITIKDQNDQISSQIYDPSKESNQQ
mgnify:CR=1 FL=1|jgi:hypothetical protein